MNRRERTLAIVTGAVIGGALLWTQLLEPTWVEYRQLDEQVHGLDQAVSRDRELHAKLEELVAERRRLDESLRPPEEAALIPWFIAHVRQLSREAGLEPTSLRFVSAQPLTAGPGQPSDAATPFAELRFELQARARQEILQEFLLRIVASDRHVRVVALSLAPETKGDELDANMSLVALAPRSGLGAEETEPR